MKPFDIALFKTFLEGKGMVTPFLASYRNHRIGSNPPLIEDYLIQADLKNVFTNAFHFGVNARWGFDYWTNMQQNFLVYWRAHKDDQGEEGWKSLHGTAKILRTNWNGQYWKHETRGETAKRYGFELPYDDIQREKDIARGAANDDDIAEFSREKDEEAIERAREAAYNGEEEVDMLAGFEAVSVKVVNRRRRIQDDEATLNFRNGGGRLTFSRSATEILNKAGFTHMTLLRNAKGDIVGKVSNEGDTTVVIDGNRGDRCANANVHNRDFATKLGILLNIGDEDFAYIGAKIIAQTNTYIAIHFTKKQ